MSTEPITLVNCQMESRAVPTQIACETTDGRCAYLRHRGGKGGVGIGATMEAAVDDWPQTYAFDHAADGLEIAEFAALLPAWITIVEQVG